MQIVIDIPESILNTIQADEMISREQLAVLQMHILNGTPLPKGHGRLVDADEIDNNIYDLTRSIDLNYGQISEVVDTVPTIIEADKEESEG